MATEAFDIDAELMAALEEKRQQETAAAQPEVAPPRADGLMPYYGPKAGEPYARSFIAPLVNDQGKVLIPGYDSAEDDRRAMQFQALDEFNRRIRTGENPADVLAQVSGRLYSNDPRSLIRAVNPPARRSAAGGHSTMQPNYDPATGKLISYSMVNPNGTVQSTMRAGAEKMPQSNTDERKMLELRMRAAQNNPFGADEAELLKMSNRFMELGTNWHGNATEPAVPQQPVTVTESGPAGISMSRQIPSAPKTSTATKPQESPDDIRSQYRAGKLTKAEAVARLKKLGFN